MIAAETVGAQVIHYLPIIITQIITLAIVLVSVARWSAKLEQKVEQKVTIQTCMEWQRACAKCTKSDFEKLWNAYNDLNGSYRETKGQLEAATLDLKSAVVELRRTNGHKK
jgi:signal transduction histidine kinase